MSCIRSTAAAWGGREGNLEIWNFLILNRTTVQQDLNPEAGKCDRLPFLMLRAAAGGMLGASHQGSATRPGTSTPSVRK